MTIPMLRQSERSDFKTCPQKWDWRWNQWLVPATPKQDARWFGTLWHLLWATVYTPPGKDGFQRQITSHTEIHQLWDQLCAEAHTSVSGLPFYGEDDEMEWNDAQVLGHIMIDGQLAEWNLDPAYEVMMPEQRFKMNIPFNQRQKDNGLPAILAPLDPAHIVRLHGTYDLPIRDHTDLVPKAKCLDWKTTNRRTNEKQLNKDTQTGTYLLTLTIVLRNLGFITERETCEYMIFSFARKAKPATETKIVDEQGRIRNKAQKKDFGEALGLTDVDMKGMTIPTLQKIADEAKVVVYGRVSKNQGSPLFWRDVVRRNRANRANQLRHIADDAELMGLTRTGDLPITKSPGEHCNWCDFSELCDVDEDGGDTETFIEDMYIKEDPYADHREGADNSKKSIIQRELDKR